MHCNIIKWPLNFVTLFLQWHTGKQLTECNVLTIISMFNNFSSLAFPDNTRCACLENTASLWLMCTLWTFSHIWDYCHIRSLIYDSVQSLIFSERELTFTFAICCRPSVCRLSVCLSSVMFVRRTQAVQIFGNISTALGTLAIHWHPLKISLRSSQGNSSAGGVKHEG